MKGTKLLAGVLCLALLTGCGGGKPAPAATPTPAAAPDPNAADLTFEAAGIRKDYPLATVNGEPVTAEEYCFWLINAILSEQEESGQPADGWDWEGVGESLKADALEAAKIYAVIRWKAKELGVTLSAQQQEEMDLELASIPDALGGEEAYALYLAQQCISREGFEELDKVYFIDQAILERLTETGEVAVTPEDLSAVVDDMVENGGFYAAKHILIATRRVKADGSGYEELSDDEKAQALARIQDLLDQIHAAGDSEEVFTALMREYSEDGRDPDTGELYSPDGYPFVYAGQMVPEFEQAALALEVGEVSDVVTTDYGYHILLRTPLDVGPLQEYALQVITPEYKYDELITQWLEEAVVEVTLAYEDLSPKDFYDRLTQMNEVRAGG